MAIDDQVCFNRWLFADPVKPRKYTTGSVGAVNGINMKDVSGARLLLKTIMTYFVDLVCFRHLPKTQHCCLCPNERYKLPLTTHPSTYSPTYSPTHPHHPPHLLLPTLPPLCAIHNITVAVTKLALNRAMLAR